MMFRALLCSLVFASACARGATPPDPLGSADAGDEVDDARLPGSDAPSPDMGRPDTGRPDMGLRDTPGGMDAESPCDTDYYPDSDGDGHGAQGGAPTQACAPPQGYVAVADDCDDANDQVYTGATEAPGDGVDQDCDGMELCFVDADDDGVRATPLQTVNAEDLACAGPGLAPAAAPEGDCDDDNPAVTTPGTEVCNGADDDCNGIVDDGNTCPCPAASRDGHIYLFCNQPSTWSQAEIFCQRAGQHLVKVDSGDENDFLTAQAISRGLDETWLGLNDRVSGGVFVWHDGTSPIYTNWNDGQPNNGDGGDQDCAELHTCVVSDSCQNPGWVGAWNDDDCNAQDAFICESP